MALISLKEVSQGFGGPLLLDSVSMQLESGERVALIGRNGTGKTTLLKLISGQLIPDDGQISKAKNIKIAYMSQEVPLEMNGTIYEIVEGGLINPGENWQVQLQIEQVIDRMNLQGDQQFGTLSAGMKRRVLLARGLVNQPDILLLDEPTNHLDIASIQWLEEFLLRWGGTLLFVTHDRVFLQKLATRIVELDRGNLFDWECDYQTYLKRKESYLEAEEAHNVLFDKKLEKEEQWIRRGIEARRTRNEGRVRALKRLREMRQERREQIGKVQMQIQADNRSGKVVIEAEHISFAYENKQVINDFSTLIQRGNKVGIIGPNGTGKTTLLRLFLGELAPQSGEVQLGTNLEIAYFDQLRTQLDEDKSVFDNVGQGRDVVTINGKNRNIYGYLEDFLFSKDRVKAPISALSGGERNRLLLARLFTKSANLLVMDEPTNDLDIETLEILESLLMDFDGTLLLVSHDRAFINNLVTSTIVLDGMGNAEEFVGGYDDWQEQALQNSEKQEENSDQRKNSASAGDLVSNLRNSRPSRTTYRQKKEQEARQKELQELPHLIEKLEKEQQNIATAMSDPAFYQQDEEKIAAAAAQLKKLEEDLNLAYERWGELENS